MITTVNRNRNPMPAFGRYAYIKGGPKAPTPRPRYINSIQILGFIPLTCATQHERLKAFSQCDCRDWKDDDCYINPVFGDSSGQYNPYKNDKNNFLLEYPFLYKFQWNDPSLSFFQLEEWNGSAWVSTAILNDDSFGVLNKLGTMKIPYFTQFTIDWQKVIMQFGEGLYRFRVNNNIFGAGSIYVSEPFCLREWNCKEANKTVKWNANITGGRIGSITDDKKIFNLCCTSESGQKVENSGPSKTCTYTWQDEVRIYAFFGKETTDYERENIEYQNGEIIKIRDEAIQKFEYETALLPKYLHDRFKAYGVMADELYVSDYNWNNSDYEIKNKRVVCDGAYAPEYDRHTRYSKATVVFKEGFQNVIRDKCCTVINKDIP
ncbi:MAG: hypothetical protein ACHQ1D_00250 [Nitrososphaerales archaeon]